MAKKEYLNNKALESKIISYLQIQYDVARYNLLIEELEETKQRKAIRQVDSSREDGLIPQYRIDLGKLKNEFSKFEGLLTTDFYALSTNFARYVVYSKFYLLEEEDAVQEAVSTCFAKINLFNPKKGKAFNYMTTCIHNHFKQLHRGAKNFEEFKKRYRNYLNSKYYKNLSKNMEDIPIAQGKME